MAYSPYDWSQSIQHRQDYIQDRLREGSPVVGISCVEGILLLTVRRTQRKIFEIYDRLIFSALGHPADIETIRNAAIDFSHREGFARSPDDVSAQRVVGVALSSVLKRAFSDLFSPPYTFRGLLGEVADEVSGDVFYALDFDGEFSLARDSAVVAGTTRAEGRMKQALKEELCGEKPSLAKATEAALRAWALGRRDVHVPEEEGEEEAAAEKEAIGLVLREELDTGQVEAGFLQRATTRQSRFKLLSAEELAPALSTFGVSDCS